MELDVRRALATYFENARLLLRECSLERRAEPLNIGDTLV
jgi:hypothetical protein